MSHIAVDGARALDALRREVDGIATLLRKAPSPVPTAIGDWTVRDVAAHLTHVWSIIEANVRGVPSPVEALKSMSDHYQQMLDDDPEFDLPTLATRLEERTASYTDAAAAAGPDAVGAWHAGIELPVPVLTTLLVSECLVHGSDIARGSKQRWVLDKDDAALVLDGFTYLLPHFTNEERARERDMAFRIHVRRGSTFDAVVEDGKLTIRPPGGKVDCHLTVDPAVFLLVGYQRIGQWGPILRGRLLAWGRRPWLGLQMTKVLNVP